MTDPVEQFRQNFLTACHCQDECVPVATSSIVSTTAGHSEDYPSPAVTDYLDEGLEAAQLVPCAEVWRAIKALGRDPVHYRAYRAAAMLDLARNPLAAEEAARRLGVEWRQALRLRRVFWGMVYRRVIHDSNDSNDS
jgi:hypothetical protein